MDYKTKKYQKIFSSKETHLLGWRFYREGESTRPNVVSCTGYFQFLIGTKTNGLLVCTIKNIGIKHSLRENSESLQEWWYRLNIFVKRSKARIILSGGQDLYM